MIEWSKVVNDILKYARNVFKEDGQTITESELNDALNILYHIIYEASGVFLLNGFSHGLEDALNKAVFTEVGEINPLRNLSIFFDSFVKRIHVFENNPIPGQKGAFVNVISHFGLTQFSDLKNYNTQGENWRGDGTGRYILYKAIIPRNENVHLAPDWDKAEVAQHLKYVLAAYLFIVHIRRQQILAVHPNFLEDPSVNNRKTVTDDDLAAYDFLKFSRASGELKRDVIRCFVLRLLAKGPIEESSIKAQVDEFVGKTTLDAHTYCLNGLYKCGKIQIIRENPKTYSLTSEEQQRLIDYTNDCSHNKMQFIKDVQTILDGTALADKTEEVLSKFKNLVTQRLKNAAIVVDNVGLQYNENESENSFLEFINADIKDIEKSKQIYKNIITVCESNDIVYRLCAGSFISSLVSTTEYNGNFPMHQRDIFLDTQVILLILCVAYDDFEPGRLYNYKIARDLISIAKNNKNSLSLKFANTYITEVKGHLVQALQLIEIADAENRKFKLHTTNVFYNHFSDLKESDKLPNDITTFKDYLYALFNLEDQDAEDDYRNFLDYSLAGQIECILNEANIELFNIHLHDYEEDTKKSRTAFNEVLKNNEKAYSTLEHDIKMGQYLFNWECKPKLFFISRDHSFDLYRKKYAELYCRSSPYFWQLFTPVNFVNSVDLLEMKFEPQTLSEDLLLLVDRDGGKDNAKYFADINIKLTNLPGITAAERRKRQRLNFELFTNTRYNDIEEDNLSSVDMIADKLNRTWDSLYNHLCEKNPSNLEKAFAPLLNDAIYRSVVINLKKYMECGKNDLNTLFDKIDDIINKNLDIVDTN